MVRGGAVSKSMNRSSVLPWPLRKLYAAIMGIHRKLQHSFKDQFDRFLPFSEEIIDRWQRARDAGFGEHTSVYDSSYMYGDLTVGDHVWIGPLTVLDGSGGLIIGDHSTIAAGVHIYTHDTIKKTILGNDDEADRAPVVIEHNCYIGAQSVIAKGVTIGHHSVVGAQSFVNKSVPAHSIVIGTPAKVVGRVKVVNGEVRLEYL